MADPTLRPRPQLLRDLLGRVDTHALHRAIEEVGAEADPAAARDLMDQKWPVWREFVSGLTERQRRQFSELEDLEDGIDRAIIDDFLLQGLLLGALLGARGSIDYAGVVRLAAQTAGPLTSECAGCFEEGSTMAAEFEALLATIEPRDLELAAAQAASHEAKRLDEEAKVVEFAKFLDRVGPKDFGEPAAPGPEPLETVSVFELFRQWWSDVGPRSSSATARTYRYHVLRSLADVPRDPRELTTPHLERYLDGLTPASAKATKAALGDFFGWMVRTGWRRDNPLEVVKRQKAGRVRVKRGWTEEELFRVFQAAIWIGRYGRRGTGEPLAWAILAQFALGLRPGELVNLTWDRVNLNGATSCVYVTETKTGVDRIVPVEALARTALEQLRAISPNGNGKVLHVGRTQYWQQVRRAAELAGLPAEKCRPYALRHSFATRLIEKGVHIRVVAELLGHADLRATLTYTVPPDDLLRAAVRLLG